MGFGPVIVGSIPAISEITGDLIIEIPPYGLLDYFKIELTHSILRLNLPIQLFLWGGGLPYSNGD